jgi:hypothetical protein
MNDPEVQPSVSETPARSRRGCRTGCLVVSVLLIAGLAWLFPTVRDLWPLLFGAKDPELTYQGTSIDNLKALHTAMTLYHDSEGQFPDASGWMEAIKPRIAQADLKKGEAEKKLIRPALLGKEGQYGYAMNDAASAKYKDDIKDPKTPLIFESTETGYNAHGDPAKLRRPSGVAIAVDGTILHDGK